MIYQGLPDLESRLCPMVNYGLDTERDLWPLKPKSKSTKYPSFLDLTAVFGKILQ